MLYYGVSLWPLQSNHDTTYSLSIQEDSSGGRESSNLVQDYISRPSGKKPSWLVLSPYTSVLTAWHPQPHYYFNLKNLVMCSFDF